MFLHGETVWRPRRCAAVLIAALVSCVGFASTAGAAEGRHYERVSPADKGQGDIIGDGETTVSARLGDAVALASRTPFGDEVGSGVSGQTQYVARRTSTGWQVHAVTPTPRPDAYQTFFVPTKLQTFSDDLRTAVVWAYDLPGAVGGTPLRNNIYVEDTATRALQGITVSQVDPLGPTDFLNMVDWGVSADAQHVAFVDTTQMLPNAASGFAPNVYQWDAGRGLSLAGILPDGTVPASGSDVQPNDYRGAMSADGSRLVFTASPNGNPELYMRIDGSTSVCISQVLDCSQSNPANDPVNVFLQAVTPDGRNVFFVTDSPLDPTTDRNNGPDLYRWTDSGDAAHDGVLTEISNTGDVSATINGNAVVGVSDDGNRVYYQTPGGRLIAWDNGPSHLISTDTSKSGDPTRGLAVTASMPGLGRVSPDGEWLAFLTNSTLGNDGVHGLTGTITNGHSEMYLYSLRADREGLPRPLTCVSCPSGAGTSDASVVPDVTAGDPKIFNDAFRPRFLSDDGQVFFSTSDALVPQDVNGVEDTYEYDASSATPSLVSTGTGKDPTSFADASANGSDVFLATRQQLVAGDRDDLVDLYDATTRAPLAIAEQAPASDCQGDTCQPPPSASPPDDAFGSVSFDGHGTGASAKAFAVARSVAIRGSAGALRVRLFAAGTLSWRGRGVQSGSVRHSRGGTFTVRLRLDRHARALLRKKGRYVTRVRLTLVSADGNEATAIARVTFRAAAKKGR